MGKLADRRQKEKASQKPVPQYYGGSQFASDYYADRADQGIASGEEGINQGLGILGSERANAQHEADVLWDNLNTERTNYAQDVDRIANHEALDLQNQQLGLAGSYGGAADASLGNFAAGRGAVQGAAGQLGANGFFGDYEGTRGGVLGAQGALLNNSYLSDFNGGQGAILNNAASLEDGNFTGAYDATKGQVLGSAAALRNTDYMGQYQGSRGDIAAAASALQNNDWDRNFLAGREGITNNAKQLESNDWLKNYESGRAGILGSADQLEGYAKGAAAEYQSSADAQLRATQESNQRNALGLAAGRGNNAVRTALATSGIANQQAALDQAVARAQENNALNQMRNQAVAQAGGLRSNLSAQDQAAAALRTEQQQAAGALRSNLSAQDQAQEALRTQQNVAAGGLRTNISQLDQAAGQLNLARDTTALDAQQRIAAADLQRGALQQQQIAQAAAVRLGLSGQQLQSAGLQYDATQAAGQLGLGLGQNDLVAAGQRAQNLQASGQLGLGLGAQDLGAAQLGAQRQQAATSAGLGLLGLRSDLYGNNAQYQLASLGQLQSLSGQNAAIGMNYGSAVTGVNQAQRDAYLGAQGQQFGAELGVDAVTEAQRQAWQGNWTDAAKFNRGLGIGSFGLLGGQ